MKLSAEKQKHLALTIVIVMVVNILGWYIGPRWLGDKEKIDNQNLVALKGKIQESEAKSKKERKNRGEAKEYQDYISAIEEKIPKTTIETWFLNELTKVANAHKLSLSTIPMVTLNDFTDFKFKDLPYTLNVIHFDCLGELNDIGKFIEDIENNHPLMEVHDLFISAGSSKGPYIHTVTMTISMVVKSQQT